MTPYVVIGIIALVLITALLIIEGRMKPASRLSRVGVLAFALVVAGILFGENPVIGYSLIGMGVVIALVDIGRRIRRASS